MKIENEDSIFENDVDLISKSQKSEIDRRLEKFKAGKTKFFTWDEVKNDIRSALNYGPSTIDC